MLSKSPGLGLKMKSWIARNDQSHLRTTMWVVWTLFVVGFACAHWQFDLAADRPAIPGLIIHTLLVGLIGLIIMTIVEQHEHPETFAESECNR